jgi:hypothetical protein
MTENFYRNIPKTKSVIYTTLNTTLLKTKGFEKYHSESETVNLTIWLIFPSKLNLVKICQILLRFRKVLDKYRLEKERGQMLA